VEEEVYCLLLAHARSLPEVLGVVATIDSGRLASIKTCEKIGMKFERKGRDEEGEFLIFRIGPLAGEA